MATVDVGPAVYTAQVGWLGLKVGSHSVLPYLCQMNRVNSRSDFHGDSTINIIGYYYNCGISWLIFVFFVPVETGMNTLQFTYFKA